MKYLDDGRFMVPVASSAVTQEEWDQIFGISGPPTCEDCDEPMEELPPGTVWPQDFRWYCSPCKRYLEVRAKGFCDRCGAHTVFCKCQDPPERTRIDSKPRKI